MTLPDLKQRDAMDCGPSCLALVTRFLGRPVPVERFRELCGQSRTGVSFLGLSRAAEALGLSVRPRPGTGVRWRRPWTITEGVTEGIWPPGGGTGNGRGGEGVSAGEAAQGQEQPGKSRNRKQPLPHTKEGRKGTKGRQTAWSSPLLPEGGLYPLR